MAIFMENGVAYFQTQMTGDLNPPWSAEHRRFVDASAVEHLAHSNSNGHFSFTRNVGCIKGKMLTGSMRLILRMFHLGVAICRF